MDVCGQRQVLELLVVKGSMPTWVQWRFFLLLSDRGVLLCTPLCTCVQVLQQKIDEVEAENIRMEYEAKVAAGAKVSTNVWVCRGVCVCVFGGGACLPTPQCTRTWHWTGSWCCSVVSISMRLV